MGHCGYEMEMVLFDKLAFPPAFLQYMTFVATAFYKLALNTEYRQLIDACCQAVLVTSLSIMRIKFLIKIANINQLSIFSIQS